MVIFYSYVSLPEGISRQCRHPQIESIIMYHIANVSLYLVGGAITILKNDGVVNGKDDIPYMENRIHVWNHQPGNINDVAVAVRSVKFTQIEFGFVEPG